MIRIDLNCDMGESFGTYTLGMDPEIMPLITSANIACGWHAGDPVVMAKTVKMAAEHGVGIGAHPGFPDLMGFGRRPMHMSGEEIFAYLVYQIGALMGICRAGGAVLRHVKPHGALYNMAVRDDRLFTAIAEAVAAVNPNLLLVALAGNGAQRRMEIGRRAGVRVVLEAFADRAYTPQGELAPRTQPGAVLNDPILVAQRVVEMIKTRYIRATDGALLKIDFQTICVHGDSPAALAMLQQIRIALAAEKIEAAPMAHA